MPDPAGTTDRDWNPVGCRCGPNFQFHPCVQMRVSIFTQDFSRRGRVFSPPETRPELHPFAILLAAPLVEPRARTILRSAAGACAACSSFLFFFCESAPPSSTSTNPGCRRASHPRSGSPSPLPPATAPDQGPLRRSRIELPPRAHLPQRPRKARYQVWIPNGWASASQKSEPSFAAGASLLLVKCVGCWIMCSLECILAFYWISLVVSYKHVLCRKVQHQSSINLQACSLAPLLYWKDCNTVY
jgi:hypothetical protein